MSNMPTTVVTNIIHHGLLSHWLGPYGIIKQNEYGHNWTKAIKGRWNRPKKYPKTTKCISKMHQSCL